ncbi:MAG TPA: tetratricopeptide repeat protein [Candidatus Dormibacteraeota bacterium]|nr:tetratricopeptide repeat protein [Candidatus Dormibacteraeota bacterium]
MVSRIPLVICTFILLATSGLAQQAPAPAPAPGSPVDLVQRGEKLSHDGKQDEALALYRQVLDKSPDSYEANLESGIALDLKGDYGKAQEYFTKALEIARPDSKQQALRALAFSYAFAGDAFKASEAEMQVFNARVAKSDSVGAAETCNELARIYLELGDPDHAFKWYKMGYDTVSRKLDLSEADKNLWLFRWESAQARVAARRGNADEAQRHVIAAKAALDKANNPNQAPFYPYLTGYVAFYAGDYKTAIAELQKAEQHDPFILVLLGQAYEKSGDAAQAKDYYRKVLEINNHNPTNAFARPLARKKLESGS